MRLVCLLPLAAALAVPGSVGGSEPVAVHSDAPQKIDVSKLNYRVGDVVVPVPSEIFNALTKLGGNLNWAGEVTKDSTRPLSVRPQIALVLGTVIANGFIAVQARDSARVKEIGKRVIDLSTSLGVRNDVISHCQGIMDAADKSDWDAVRTELDRAQGSVRTAMDRLKGQDESQLISIGGWLRGTQSLTSLVRENYTTDRAELLHQPDLLNTFDKQLNDMSPKVRSNKIVIEVQDGLKNIRPLVITPGDKPIEQSSVDKIYGITSDLLKSISPQ